MPRQVGTAQRYPASVKTAILTSMGMDGRGFFVGDTTAGYSNPGRSQGGLAARSSERRSEPPFERFGVELKEEAFNRLLPKMVHTIRDHSPFSIRQVTA